VTVNMQAFRASKTPLTKRITASVQCLHWWHHLLYNALSLNGYLSHYQLPYRHLQQQTSTRSKPLRSATTESSVQLPMSNRC